MEGSTGLETRRDVVVIGGGQTGLALGYYLRRTGLDYEILDAEPGPGGAWRHGWNSLRLFSPARWCSLPGWLMPGGPDYYPSRDEMLAYMTAYEERYTLPIRRPVRVSAVRRQGGRLVVETAAGRWLARAVVSATGTWSHPVLPDYPGRDRYLGVQLHSACYRSPLEFTGQRVLVVGGGNSGAQILAELSDFAETLWVSRRVPGFLPEGIDGRDLFEWATQRYLARVEGRPPPDVPGGLGHIVLVPPVRAARERGALQYRGTVAGFTETSVAWPDGRETPIDAVIWCTGFLPALDHLRPLGIVRPDDTVALDGTRAVEERRLWLVGYGEWTGYASATIIGVGRTAKSTAAEIASVLTGIGRGAQ